jgi:hypothetical protein
MIAEIVAYLRKRLPDTANLLVDNSIWTAADRRASATST